MAFHTREVVGINTNAFLFSSMGNSIKVTDSSLKQSSSCQLALSSISFFCNYFLLSVSILNFASSPD